MKKNKLSKITVSALAIGSVAGMGIADAFAMQDSGLRNLGSAASLRTELIQQNVQGSQSFAFSTQDKEAAEGKCGEGKCGEGKCGEEDEEDKDGGEGKCGEGKCGEGKCGEE